MTASCGLRLESTFFSPATGCMTDRHDGQPEHSGKEPVQWPLIKARMPPWLAQAARTSDWKLTVWSPQTAVVLFAETRSKQLSDVRYQRYPSEAGFKRETNSAGAIEVKPSPTEVRLQSVDRV